MSDDMLDAVDILSYDDKHAIESDAYASFEPELVAEKNGTYRYTIYIDPVACRDLCRDLIALHKNDFYIDAREARVLAARLLKAADADDAARGVSTR